MLHNPVYNPADNPAEPINTSGTTSDTLDHSAKKAIDQTSVNSIPDPWEEKDKKTSQSPPSWQFPLDPKHGISASPTPDGILSPQADPAAISASPEREPDSASPGTNPTERLLEEELKVNATQAKSLWDRIRDLLTLLWWGDSS